LRNVRRLPPAFRGDRQSTRSSPVMLCTSRAPTSLCRLSIRRCCERLGCGRAMHSPRHPPCPPLFSSTFQAPPNWPDLASFLVHTRVVLNSGDQHIAHLTADGTFTFSDLATASYTLQVHSPYFEYDPLRVDVSKKFDNDVRVVKATPDMLVGGMPPVPVPYYPGTYTLCRTEPYCCVFEQGLYLCCEGGEERREREREGGAL
jgi:hypothetical protein